MSELKDFDTYWLTKGQTLVDNTFENLLKHLKNHNNYLKVLLGFYTTIGLTAELVTGTTNKYVYLTFALPYIILFLAIFKISVGQTVATETLDLRSPLKINQAYADLVSTLKASVMSAKIWVARATIAVLIGGTVCLYLINCEKKEQEAQDKIEARIDKISGYEDENLKTFMGKKTLKVTQLKDGNKISVEAKFVEDEVLLIEMITTKGDTVTKAIEVPKLCDFKTEILDAKQLISTSIK